MQVLANTTSVNLPIARKAIANAVKQAIQQVASTFFKIFYHSFPATLAVWSASINQITTN